MTSEEVTMLCNDLCSDDDASAVVVGSSSAAVTTAKAVKSADGHVDGVDEIVCFIDDDVFPPLEPFTDSSVDRPVAAAEEATTKTMDSATELLHFIPPTFSRLPPDGDEFPNSWSDEHQQQLSGKLDNKSRVFRSEISFKDAQSKIGSPPPPPLPSTEPPRDSIEDLSTMAAVSSMPPPLPPKTIGRKCSVEDRKRVFEAQKALNATTNGCMNSEPTTNGFHASSPVTPRAQSQQQPSNVNHNANYEPSKKSVKDKIAMFSSRSSSSEDSVDTVLAKPTSCPPRTSSLPRSGGSSFSKSSDNLVTAGLSLSNGHSMYNGSPSRAQGLSNVSPCMNRSALDLSTNSSGALPLPPKKVTDVNSGFTKPSAFYGNGNVKGYHDSAVTKYGVAGGKNLHERSQSMIDVAATGEQRNGHSYQTPNHPAFLGRYGSTASSRTSTLMEQRRKCMSKLRGLVIPDPAEQVTTMSSMTTTSVSVADLPTIISKDAVIPPLTASGKPPLQQEDMNSNRRHVTRTESLDRINCRQPAAYTSIFSNNGNSIGYNNCNSAKTQDVIDSSSTWNKFPMAAVQKYSPAFKRRSLTPYQTALSSPTTKLKTPAYTNGINKHASNGESPTTEPKSLDSLTSPRSDSSFEFSSPSPPIGDQKKKIIKRNGSLEKCSTGLNNQKMISTGENKKPLATNGTVKYGKGGKLEDSDNDSAVSSSRSSISHGLSPPNSPTPEESSSTPDPPENNMTRNDNEDSANSDEGWRVLKAQSVEAINRKNVLTSAKYSSGGGGHVSEDSVSNGSRRRSDDEEAGYADAEAEDTESSCSELEVSKSRRRHVVAPSSRTNMGQWRGGNKADTEEDEDAQTPPSHSQQSSVDLGDEMILPNLTESPLQAIFDMEVKMAYINEICDALPATGRNERYFSRRDSEATVIERPIEPAARKMSVDNIDSAAERRARNRSSSGNESDFSSSISVGSQNTKQFNSIATGASQLPREDRWSLLEKKYSKSMTSVNLLANQKQEATLTPATSVPKIVTSAGEVVEKKIEQIIEKVVVDPGRKLPNTVIPRNRNDFKSLSEKWQQISTEGKPVPPAKPVMSEKLSLSPQTSVQGSVPTARTRLVPPATPDKTESMERFVPSKQQAPESSCEPVHGGWPTPDVPKARRSEISTPAAQVPIGSTKRSVSVNDIRKAFEKAESVVNTFGREDNSSLVKKEPSGLNLPSAHFRVSSFDSTTSEESSATTPAGIYGSSNSLVSSAPRDPYGSITSLASSTSLISPQELQQLIDEANQSLEEAGTPSHEVAVVILHREFAGGSLGITLAGGADYETKEITVHKVITGSIADRDSRVHRGDRILSINGKSTKGLTHREALNLLKAPRTEVVLVVSRGRHNSNGFQTIEETSTTLERTGETPGLAGLLENEEDNYKWGPLRTVILVKDGAGLGFSLEGGKGSIHGDKPLTVKKIFVGGPAEKNGELKVGDLITSINSVNMATRSRTEAWNFMKKMGDGEVKITVRSPLS